MAVSPRIKVGRRVRSELQTQERAGFRVHIRCVLGGLVHFQKEASITAQ